MPRIKLILWIPIAIFVVWFAWLLLKPQPVTNTTAPQSTGITRSTTTSKPVSSTPNYKGLLANTVYNKEFENPPKGGLTSGTLVDIKNKMLTLDETNKGATTVLITDSTRIEKYDEISGLYNSVTRDALEVGQHVAAVGEPSNGMITADIVSIDRVIAPRAPKMSFEVF
jgi:hypothetical protein